MNNIGDNKLCNTLNAITYILVTIGAINWGLIGLFEFDLVLFFFKEVNMITRIIYSVIGLGGLRMLYIIWNKVINNECKIFR